MKTNLQLFVVFFAVMGLCVFGASAQTVHQISAGDGTLEAAIATAVDGDIIELVDIIILENIFVNYWQHNKTFRNQQNIKINQFFIFRKSHVFLEILLRLFSLFHWNHFDNR